MENVTLFLLCCYIVYYVVFRKNDVMEIAQGVKDLQSE